MFSNLIQRVRTYPFASFVVGFHIAVILGCFVFILAGCDDSNTGTQVGVPTSPTVPVGPQQDGIAIALVIDTSGSMDGERITEARKAAVNVATACEAYAAKTHKPVKLAIYSFSDSVRQVKEFDVPSAALTQQAVDQLSAGGGTAIGDAVLVAKAGLDKTGLSQRHVVVLTDGESNAGQSPEAVADAINAQQPSDRCTVNMVTIDVNASAIAGVKSKGWKVIQIADASSVVATVDAVVSDDVLLEK